MISLRTHAISLAAVFLALAVGVALGSGLLSNTVLSGLRDDTASGTAAVAVTRSDAAMSHAVSTVDDVDAASGRITTVLALGDLINGRRPGQYGVGQDASSVTLPQ